MSNGRLYVGMTNDIKRRQTEHGVKPSTRTTKTFGAEAIIYVEEFPDRISAHKRELQLKGWSRAKKLALAEGRFNELRRLSKSHRNRGS
jgi:putative endonuclease